MDRQTFLSVVEAALAQNAPSFAREACAAWLGQWAGDFRVRGLLARAHVALGEVEPAFRHLQQATVAQPEALANYTSLAEMAASLTLEKQRRAALACVNALRPGSITDLTLLPGWADSLGSAVANVAGRRYAEARADLESVLISPQEFPLAGWLLVKAAWLEGDYAAVLSAGEAQRASWPACPGILLAMAQAYLAMGQSAKGVEYLHLASIADPAHEMADALLGPFDPYRSLWPASIAADLPLPIPADVAIAAGLNRIGSGAAAPENSPPASAPAAAPAQSTYAGDYIAMTATPSGEIAPMPGEKFRGPASADPPNADEGVTAQAPVAQKGWTGSPPSGEEGLQEESLEQVRRELEKLARRLGRRKSLPDEDRRRPAYLVLTSLDLLIKKYGAASGEKIRAALDAVVKAQQSRRGWSAYLVLVDDAQSLHALGLQPVVPGNAWQVKQLLTQIDQSLDGRAEMIGAVLIIGGHEIIPFHLLPNPADDDDRDVPSDNPYASRDENYFVPEWPVGRIPTPSSDDPAFLLQALQGLASPGSGASGGFQAWMSQWFYRLFHPAANRFRRNLGYTASIWRQASLAVYHTVGQPASLLVSPPTTAKNLPPEAVALPEFSYFNLHGAEDAPEWFGQRAPVSGNESATEFPVALSPAQVSNSGRAPAVVFTEACYGGNVMGKTVEAALALKFLASGTRSVVASTKISYGAASLPLIAADLLARDFWQNVVRGVPTGEALRLAKLSFAKETHQQQGYLDAEDQKTLISYVHFGDPLFSPAGDGDKVHAKTLVRRKSRPRTPTFLHTVGAPGSELSSDPRLELALKRALRQYLPAMGNAHMRVYQAQASRPARDGGSTAQPHDDSAKPNTPAWVVSLARSVQNHGASHTQFARVSFDASGRVVKLVVSR